MTRKDARYLLAGSISVLTFLVYLPALRNAFVEWDDSLYVYANLNIKVFDWVFLKWAFSTFHASNWHPLTWISHALDYAVWGLNPAGHHLTSIALHALNTFLVVLLSARLIESARHRHCAADRTETADETEDDEVRATPPVRRSVTPAAYPRFALVAAGVTGLLFGIHPIHVESVAWVAERKDLLCAFFYLLSVTAYASYASRKTYTTYFLSLSLFALALLSKPMAVSLPFVLLILDWYPFERLGTLRSARAVLAEKVPFMALSLVSAVVTVVAQKQGGAMAFMESLPLSTRLLVAARALVAYLGNMAFPLRLVPYYPYPNKVSLLSPEYVLPLVLLATFSAFCLSAIRRQKIWPALWAFYLVTLMPVLGIVQVGAQAMADRYTYLPSIAPFLGVGVAVARGLGAARRRKFPLGGALAAAVLILASSLSYFAVKQIAVWKDTVSLWNDVIAKTPGRIPFAFNNRGLGFSEQGDYGRALKDFDMAIALSPSYFQAYANRCKTYMSIGELDRALEDCTRVILLQPFPKVYYLRGIVFEEKGEPARAAEDYRRAMAMNPAYVEAYVRLGILRGKSGAIDESIGYFDQALRLQPNYAKAYGNRGFAYFLKGQPAKALPDLDEAISLDGDYAEAYMNRAAVFLKMGERPRAVADYQRACALGVKEGCAKALMDNEGD